MDGLTPCSHKEADTWMFMLARDATLEGSKSPILKADDTDVFVIAASALPLLHKLGLQRL